MAPSSLQGLNIVHPPQQQNPYLSDQDLLAVPNFPDLSAQLDLWTNLSFQSDEPLIPNTRGSKESYDDKSKRSYSRGEKDVERYNILDEESQDIGKVAEVQSHENVVTGTVIPPSPPSGSAPTNGNNQHQQQQSMLNLQGLNLSHALDLNNLLAGIGLDPFHAIQQPPPQLASSASLAQLISFHSAAQSLRQPSVTPTPAPAPPASAPTSSTSTFSATPPATKRARTSVSSASRNAHTAESPEEEDSPEADDKSGSPLTASEDKRRRNTAASARFRLKKKEREAALERKAKELEGRVGELEKECEALRRENGWLKGLVVGVTGAGAVQQQQVSVGTKRGRDEVESGSA